jgi:hypothetical protein
MSASVNDFFEAADIRHCSGALIVFVVLGKAVQVQDQVEVEVFGCDSKIQ